MILMNYPMTEGKAMLKKTLNCVISLFLPWCTLTLNAQSDLPRFETAGQFGLMYTGYRAVGVGGRFSFNASEMVAFEGTLDHFPQDKFADLIAGVYCSGSNQIVPITRRPPLSVGVGNSSSSNKGIDSHVAIRNIVFTVVGR